MVIKISLFGHFARDKAVIIWLVFKRLKSIKKIFKILTGLTSLFSKEFVLKLVTFYHQGRNKEVEFQAKNSSPTAAVRRRARKDRGRHAGEREGHVDL